MKLTDLRRIYQVIEHTLTEERELDINFIRNDMRKVLVNYAAKSANCETIEEKKHVVEIVDEILNQYISSIRLKHAGETPDMLNTMTNDSFDLLEADKVVQRKMETKEATKIPTIEKRIKELNRKYEKKPMTFNSEVHNFVSNLTKEEMFSIGGIIFDDYGAEEASYCKSHRYNGDSLVSSCSAGHKPDNIVTRDGMVILCFEELGYSLNPSVFDDKLDVLFESFAQDKQIRNEHKEELSAFSLYEDARRVTGFVVDETCLFLGEQYREQLNKNAEALTMLSLTSLEMGVVFGREAHIHRYQRAFDGLPDTVQKTLKETYMEIIKDNAHSDTYIEGARQFVMRHAGGFTFDDSRDIFVENVEKGVELYKNGDKNGLAKHLEMIDPFSRAAIRLEVKYGSQEQDNSPAP